MLEVDWASLFKSFYEKVRIKIAYRESSTPPPERLLEMDKRLYLISIHVEGLGTSAASNPKDDPQDDDLGDEGEEDKDDDDYDDLDDPPESMETNKGEGDGAGSASKRLATQTGGNRVENSGKHTQKLPDTLASMNTSQVYLGVEQNKLS
jgi:hypothetical protein